MVTQTEEAMPGRVRPRDWRRAWRALRRLWARPEDTEAVFEILDAMQGSTDERSFQAFIGQPQGRRLLTECPRLLAALSDREELAGLPADSLGRAYLRFMEDGGLNAESLVEAEAESGMPAEDDPDRRWFAERGRDSHDLWHVLTGYGRDDAGEVALLAFTYANYRNHGLALILLVSAASGPWSLSFWWPRYLWQAYRRGRAARLDFAPYEAWLSLPIEQARTAAGIVPPNRAHPRRGILVADQIDANLAAG